VERRLDKSWEVGLPDGEESEAWGKEEKRPKRGRREDWLKEENQEELRVKRECKRCEEGEREESKRLGSKEEREAKLEGSERNNKWSYEI
jgi:hypothetical protein